MAITPQALGQRLVHLLFIQTLIKRWEEICNIVDLYSPGDEIPETTVNRCIHAIMLAQKALNFDFQEQYWGKI